MSENDTRIKVVKSHDQGQGSIEFCIPKEFQKRYDLTEPGHLILIPEENYFKVMKLQLIGVKN
jgi:hypothetical protein